MITVEEAKHILISNTSSLKITARKKAKDCLHYFLAEDIYSDIDLPPFDQSNVDGYGIKFSDNVKWKLKGEIKAGDNPKIQTGKDEAVRIFTGAVVPKGIDCIIMQENVLSDGNIITLNKKDISLGNFIRIKGSQIKKGELAITKDTMISPAVIGFLSALGKNIIKVYKKPKIFLIITGNELQPPDNKLSFGKVYDSNSFLIMSALDQMNLKTADVIFVKDNRNKLMNSVSECLGKADVILISGGVSVGKYDFVNEVLEKLGTTKLFYKVSQRPGKPLYFGKNKEAYVFGLPGNPGSVLTCFYEYVYPFLKKLQGYDKYFLKQQILPASKDINKNFMLSNFIKAKIINNEAEPLEGQASYILKTFVDTDCFIYLPLDKYSVKAGEDVEVHLLPG